MKSSEGSAGEKRDRILDRLLLGTNALEDDRRRPTTTAAAVPVPVAPDGEVCLLLTYEIMVCQARAEEEKEVHFFSTLSFYL